MQADRARPKALHLGHVQHPRRIDCHHVRDRLHCYEYCIG